MSLPSHTQLMLPLLQTLKDKGGAARPCDLYDEIADQFELSDEDRNGTVNAGQRKVNAFDRRLRWVRQTAVLTHAGSWLHIDPQGQFYDRQAQPITRENALEQAGHTSAHSMGDNAQVQSRSGDNNNDQGISL